MPLDTVSDELSVTACETFGLSASPHAGPGPRLSSFGVGRGHDLRDHRFLDRKVRWRVSCAIPKRESCSTNTSPETALPCSSTLAGLAPRAWCRSGSMAPIDRGYVQCGSRFAIRPASLCSGSAARSGIADLRLIQGRGLRLLAYFPNLPSRVETHRQGARHRRRSLCFSRRSTCRDGQRQRAADDDVGDLAHPVPPLVAAATASNSPWPDLCQQQPSKRTQVPGARKSSCAPHQWAGALGPLRH